MALVSVQALLKDAEKGGYAVPAFNAYNVESVVSILSTAQNRRSPVIVQAYSRLFQSYDAVNIAVCVKAMADRMDIPVALHLDHGARRERYHPGAAVRVHRGDDRRFQTHV